MIRKLAWSLNQRLAFRLALLLFLISSLATFWYGHLTGFSDEGHYWSLGQGLHHGEFSAWYFLPFDTPETLRTWGYPFFLYLCQFFSSSYFFVQIVQFLLYLSTIWLCLRIIEYYYSERHYRTIFIILLIFNNHLAFYAGVLVGESIFLFFIILFVYVYLFSRENLSKWILLALICFVLYQLRPVFLMFPLLLFIYRLFRKTNFKYNLVFIGLFLLTLIPYGLWNKANHGVFKLTPLEGGIGVMYQGGYWDYRLPIGFKAPYYWGIAVDNDLLQPRFLSRAEQDAEAVRFVQEWESMLKELKEKHSTYEDSLREIYMSDSNYAPLRNFKIYSARYTMARENMIKEKLFGEIRTNPGFYIKTRVYNFFRQWVTGLNADQLKKARDLKDIVIALYPFAVTFLFIFCGLIWILITLFRNKISWKRFEIFILLIGYFAIINLPFGVMSRYTVPVHLLILMLLAVTLSNRLPKERNFRK